MNQNRAAIGSRPNVPLVNVVFITYERIDLLERAVHQFLARSPYPNVELLVTDDGSSPPAVERLKNLPVDEVILSERNTGLGPNTNRGLRAANGEYVLHYQDDFLLCSEEPFIERAIEIMERHPEVGLVRLHHLTAFPNYRDYSLADGTRYSILEFDQPPIKNRIYIYLDHPHLKRRDFHERAGYFAEGLPTGDTEDEFCLRFLEKRPYYVATFWRSDLF